MKSICKTLAILLVFCSFIRVIPSRAAEMVLDFTTYLDANHLATLNQARDDGAFSWLGDNYNFYYPGMEEALDLSPVQGELNGTNYSRVSALIGLYLDRLQRVAPMMIAREVGEDSGSLFFPRSSVLKSVSMGINGELTKLVKDVANPDLFRGSLLVSGQEVSVVHDVSYRGKYLAWYLLGTTTWSPAAPVEAWKSRVDALVNRLNYLKDRYVKQAIGIETDVNPPFVEAAGYNGSLLVSPKGIVVTTDVGFGRLLYGQDYRLETDRSFRGGYSGLFSKWGWVSESGTWLGRGVDPPQPSAVWNDADFRPRGRALAMRIDGKIVMRKSGLDEIFRADENGLLEAKWNFAANPNTSGGTDAGLGLADGTVVVKEGYRLVSLKPDGSASVIFRVRQCMPGGEENSGEILCVALQPPDGVTTLQPKILAGVCGRDGDGKKLHKLIRLNLDGTLDPSFGTAAAQGAGFGTQANYYIEDVICQSDGKIVIGGQFTEVGSVARAAIARLTREGAVEAGYHPSLKVPMTKLPPRKKKSWENTFMMAATMYLNEQDELSWLGSDGLNLFNVDVEDYDGYEPLDVYPPSYVLRLALQADGKVVLLGSFAEVDGVVRHNIARLNADGSLDQSFQISNEAPAGAKFEDAYDDWPDVPVFWHRFVELALQPDGRVLLVGSPLPHRYPEDPLPTDEDDRLTYEDAGRILWQRSGRLPDVYQVRFEESKDGQAWTELGHGRRVQGTTCDWEFTGASLQTTGHIRARGLTHRGGLVEKLTTYQAPPAVTALPPAKLGATKVTLRGNVQNDGLAVTECGVVFSDNNADPLIGGDNVTRVPTSGVEGDFSVNVTGLWPNQNYTFKAYAINSKGLAYSRPATFKTQEGSNDTVLVALSPDTGTLSPAFDPAVTSYTLTVAENTTSLRLTATARNDGARLRLVDYTNVIKGWDLQSGVPSPELAIERQSSHFKLHVYGEGAGLSFYSVDVMRVAPPTLDFGQITNISTSSLTIKGFITSNGTYIYERGIRVLSDNGQLQRIIKLPDAASGESGSFSVDVYNLEPTTPYFFQIYAVTARGPVYSGSTNVRTKSNNNNLSGLYPDIGTLAPAFSPSQTWYDCILPANTSSVRFQPTKADANATVRINGVAIESGSFSSGFSSGSVQIEVTSEFGVSKTYNIVIRRPAISRTFTSMDDVPYTAEGFTASASEAALTLAFPPPTGATLTVINNTSAAFINGEFLNIRQGDTIQLSYNGIAFPFVANYYGGTGNDLVLQWANVRPMSWGMNDDGQLGNGGTTSTNAPGPVTLQGGALAGKTVISLAAGYRHSVALCSDGSIAAWGANGLGQLGNNTTTPSSIPVAVIQSSGALAGKKVVAIAAGLDFTLALCSDGTVATWGAFPAGSSYPWASSVPVPIQTSAPSALSGKSVVAIAAGWTQRLALCSDGRMVFWGGERYDTAYGFASDTDLTIPQSLDWNIPGLTIGSIRQIWAGSVNNFAWTSDRKLLCWGGNAQGQLGLGHTNSPSVGVKDWSGWTSLKAFAMNSDRTQMAIHSSQWGDSFYGWGGGSSTYPVESYEFGYEPNAKKIKSLATHAWSSVALMEDGSLKNGGYNVSTAALAAGEKIISACANPGGLHYLHLVAAPVTVPIVTTFSGRPVSPTEAVLLGLVRPNGVPQTKVTFEYGTTTSYGSTVEAALGESSWDGTGFADTYDAKLTGLQPNTTYHFRIVAAGFVVGGDMTFTTYGTANLNPAGSLAGRIHRDLVTCMAPLPDGQTIVVTQGMGSTVQRLNGDGSVDSSFATATSPGTFSLAAIQPDGKVLVAGAFTTINGQSRSNLARLDSAGNLEAAATFNPPSFAGAIRGLLVLPDGKFMVQSYDNGFLNRLNADGTLDSSFSLPAGIHSVSSLALQADGKLVIGANFNDGNKIVRLQTNGQLDGSFGARALSGAANSIAVQADGKIVVGGSFSSVDGQSRRGVARLDADGNLESTATFNVGSAAGSPGYVSGIALQADGRILVGGNFTSFDGVAVGGLVRLQPNGTLESATDFERSSALTFMTIALKQDGTILATGASGFRGLFSFHNNAATQSLSVPDTSQIVWTRGGSAPEIACATFEASTDGITWSRLGVGTRVGATANWQISGLTLPITGFLRASGTTVFGNDYSSSGGLVETTLGYTTEPPMSLPMVANAVSSDIGATTVTLGGEVTSNGYPLPTERGVIFSETALNNAPTIGGPGVVTRPAATSGIFTVALASLKPHTAYSFRAYAVNSVGTSYTSTATFNTANSVPLAPAALISGTTGDPQTVTVEFPRTDPDGDAVVITGVQSGTGLTVGGFTATTATFTPTANFAGMASFAYTVRDSLGASATGTIKVAVSDNDTPVVAAHANLAVEATYAGGAQVAFAAGSATDNIRVVTMDYSPGSGATFPIGTTQVVVTASDEAGNTGTSHFNVTVADSTPPAFSAIPADMTHSATDESGAWVSFASPVASDLVDGKVAVTCVPASGSLFPIGTTPVICMATDSRGNSKSVSFAVTVTDSPPPTVAVDGGDAVFAATPAMNVPRVYHSATPLADGRVLVAGGIDTETKKLLLSTELFDPVKNTWTAAGSLAVARASHLSVLLPTGRVLVLGGTGGGGTVAGAELFDPTTNSWSSAGRMIAARTNAAAVLLNDGRVLVTGGYRSGVPLAGSEIYDPATNTWSAAAALSTKRYNHSAALIRSTGKVMVIGGEGSEGALASVEIYDPQANAWSNVASLGTARSLHKAELLADERMLVTGGFNDDGAVASAEMYHAATDEWLSAGSMASPRMAHEMTVLSNGKVVVTGGYGEASLANTELYNPDTNIWSAGPNLSSARHNHRANLLADGRLMISGGYDEDTGSLRSCEILGLVVPERTLVVQSGTFSSTHGNSAVTLAASWGVVTKDDSTGTWSWTGGGIDGPSTQTVIITATDDRGQAASASFAFTVTNVAPEFDLGADEELSPGASLLSRTVEFTDPGADGWFGTVDYGDGTGVKALSVNAAAKTFALNHAYAAAGSYTVSVTFHDDDGGSATHSYAVSCTAAVVSFSSAVVSVPQGSTSVTLPLSRSGSMHAFSLKFYTASGGAGSMIPPFAPAILGTDFRLEGTALPRAEVEFPENTTSGEVRIVLLPKTGTALPNKRFFISIDDSSPDAGHLPPQLGAITTMEVQILATDTVKPTLTVTAPTTAATLFASTPIYTVKGVAGDAKGIDRVEVVLNGGEPVNAIMGGATSNTSRPYSLEIDPVAGANTLAVTAYDLRGNSTTVTRSFVYTRRHVLSISRSAPDGVALDAAGTVALAATPATAASTLAPVTANANPKTSAIVPGATAKLTATPKAGYVFSHWSGVPAGAIANGNVITFSMPTEDVDGVSAHFVVNPFPGEPGSSNIFYGLIRPDGATPRTNATCGFFTGTLSPASGLFSGRILMDGLTQAYAGCFYGDGSFVFNVGTTRQRALNFGGGKSLSLSAAAGVITATVTQDGRISVGSATRGRYSAARKVPAPLLNQRVPATVPVPNKGFLTVALPAKGQTPPLAASAYPQGTGYATITLSDNGTLSLSGVLADGSALTGSSGIVAGNAAPIYVQLTTPGAAATMKGGSFSGILTFDTAQADSDVSGADILWLRPTVAPAASPAAAAAATALYTEGWPTGIQVDAVGALYNKMRTVQSSLGLPAADAADGNALLNFSLGRLTAEITKTKFNITDSKVIKIPATDASYSLVLAPATGAFSGTFAPNWASPNAAKPAFKGILLQKGASTGGYGYVLSNATNDPDPESGRVTLGAP